MPTKLFIANMDSPPSPVLLTASSTQNNGGKDERYRRSEIRTHEQGGGRTVLEAVAVNAGKLAFNKTL
jgi:hypothetical protein